MTETTSLECDNCGNELITHSQYPAGYSLQLKAINTNINNSGEEFTVLVRPPIDGTKHFCDKPCLMIFLKEGKV